MAAVAESLRARQVGDGMPQLRLGVVRICFGRHDNGLRCCVVAVVIFVVAANVPQRWLDEIVRHCLQPFVVITDILLYWT